MCSYLPRTLQLTDEYEEGSELGGIDKAERPCVSILLNLGAARAANTTFPIGLLKKFVKKTESLDSPAIGTCYSASLRPGMRQDVHGV
jgi:hypothetical protein